MEEVKKHVQIPCKSLCRRGRKIYFNLDLILQPLLVYIKIYSFTAVKGLDLIRGTCFHLHGNFCNEVCFDNLY